MSWPSSFVSPRVVSLRCDRDVGRGEAGEGERVGEAVDGGKP
jgi:hypothetical protein